MVAKTETFQLRLSPAERRAWESDAARRDMALAQWIRSACATFLVQGKATILVPAGHDVPGYVEQLKRDSGGAE